MLRRRTKSREEPRADEVAALIEMLKTQGNEGEADVHLVARIESLLDLREAS